MLPCIQNGGFGMTTAGGKRPRPWLGALFCAVVAGASALPSRAAGQQAASAATHAHVPLEANATLDWAALLDATLAAHPRRAEVVAHAAEADAWQRRGKQWLAAAPSLYFSYLSDRPRDDLGQREYESGVELPLWRVGQRRAVQSVAAAAAAGSAAAVAALRLEAAGLLRGALWDIEAANNALAAARDARAVAADLVAAVERRYESGDLARADVLLARTTLLEREQAVLEAEAAVVDAERSYRSITNLDSRPVQFAEPRSALDELPPSHPLLTLAAAGVLRAESELDLASRDVRGAMTVTFGPHREYDAGGTVPRDSVALEVRVPVGGGRHGATQTAGAARSLAAAQGEHGLLLRRLELDLHEAEHTLTVLERAEALAGERDALGAEQLRTAQAAFAQGEIELRELLRVQEATLAARREVERLSIERQRTVAAFNQALGVIP